MVRKKRGTSNKRRTSNKRKLTQKKTSKKIEDIEFSKFLNKGTDASSDIINYNYQHQNNILDFLYKLYQDKVLKDVSFFKYLNDATLEIDILNKKIHPMYLKNTIFINKLKKCLKKRFTPLSIRVLLPIETEDIESHANVIIIDSDLKRVEIFEPHGYKNKYSNTYESVSKYHNKIDLLRLYFKKILPEYTLVNVVNYIKDISFQAKYDARSGYCVTWSTLYAHYRILNPKIKISDLLKYLYKKINLNLLLRYARYIEEKLKNKI